MQLQLTLLLLKTGQQIICLSEQLEYEPSAHLVEPYEVTGKTKVTLSQWPPHSKDEHVLLYSEALLTATTPTDKLRDAYLKKIGKTLEEITPAQAEQMLLQENEQIIDEELDPEYEPAYIEE